MMDMHTHLLGIRSTRTTHGHLLERRFFSGCSPVVVRISRHRRSIVGAAAPAAAWSALHRPKPSLGLGRSLRASRPRPRTASFLWKLSPRAGSRTGPGLAVRRIWRGRGSWLDRGAVAGSQSSQVHDVRV
jgi:hypothetical protein